MTEKWYRYEERRYAPPLDEFDNVCGPGRVELLCMQFTVLKHTPKGVRLENGRFVLKGARKRYACPTREQAKESFLARKHAQLRILNAQINNVRQAIALIHSKNTILELVI